MNHCRLRRLLEAEAERANLESVAAGRAMSTERSAGECRGDVVGRTGRGGGDGEDGRGLQGIRRSSHARVARLATADVARAIAEPIGNVKDITIIDTEGANKLTRVTANTVRQVDSVLESFTGGALAT